MFRVKPDAAPLPPPSELAAPHLITVVMMIMIIMIIVIIMIMITMITMITMIIIINTKSHV